MGTCCAAHLAAKVKAYARNAENGAVTVRPIEDPPYGGVCDHIIGRQTVTTTTDALPDTRSVEGPVYCMAPAEFTVSYHPKKET